MTDVKRLKSLAPELYGEILDLETELYKHMEMMTNGITKVRNRILNGQISEAKELFDELKEKAHAET